jgi:protein-arginine kinase activator protein McsA
LNPNLEIGTITQEELIKQEIEPLEELMAEQIANEEYLEAKKTHDKIEELKKKYKL